MSNCLIEGGSGKIAGGGAGTSYKTGVSPSSAGTRGKGVLVRKIVAAIFVFAAVFALTWYFYFMHSPLGKQTAYLKLCRQHVPAVEAKLRRVPGTAAVKVSIHTRGAIVVKGSVADMQIAEGVARAVETGTTPVIVEIFLNVGEAEAFRKIVEPANGGMVRAF